MFGKRITLFKLFGFQVKIDLSWLILGLLITWSLSQGYFPFVLKDLPKEIYWFMGVAGAIGLFVSIIFHEFSHSLVARRFGIPIKGITLFIFGGVAEMDDEPPSAKAEFSMAIAGPLSSVFMGIIFYMVFLLGKNAGWPTPINGVFSYLGFINWLLAGFNMVPAFPLDGGRVLRSALWKWKKNLRWATKIASRIGSLFGMVLIFMGIMNVFIGNFIGGMWWFIIGIFLRNASQISYQHLIVRRLLEGESVQNFMRKDPVAVPSSITIEQLVEDFIYKYHFKMLPVVEGGNLAGCVTTRQVKDIPREKWRKTIVRDIASSCSKENTISSDIDAMKAFSIMNRTGNSRLMVAEDNRLTGVITLKDIMQFLSVKMDLDEPEG
jgi:Zn-dependent protease/predicted transcriptional regulator